MKGNKKQMENIKRKFISFVILIFFMTLGTGTCHGMGIKQIRVKKYEDIPKLRTHMRFGWKNLKLRKERTGEERWKKLNYE